MKKLLTLLILVCSTWTMQGQIVWSPNPSNQDFECDDTQNNTDITDYLATLTATSAGCDPVTIVHNYVDPGDFSCNDLIVITLTATDACGNTDVETIDVSIDDVTDPSWDTTAPNVTESCDGIGNITGITTFINNVLTQVTASVSDDCTNPIDLVITDDWDGAPVECPNEDVDVTFTVTDDCGNQSDFTATYTALDDAGPSFDTPTQDLIIDPCVPANDPAIILNHIQNLANSVISDNCTPGSNIVVSDDWDGDPPNVCGGAGVEVITLTATDDCGNESTSTFQVIVDDFDAPTITNITTQLTFECHQEDIDVLAEIDNILIAAVASDLNDCTIPNDLTWNVTNYPPGTFPTTTDPNCPGETIAGDWEFDVTVEDECGNVSAIVTVIITQVDNNPPQPPINLPMDLNLECGDEIPDPDVLYALDDCWSIEALYDEVIIYENCDNQLEIHRTWIFEDGCLNYGGEHTQIIIVDDSEGPMWLGNTDDYLPGDIEILVADCSFGFTFPNGYFENQETGEAWPDFPLMDGVHWEENCSGSFFTASIPPNEEFGEGETEVVYTVTDACGNTLEHTFIVNIICSNCVGGGIFCPECETSIEDGCFTCNIDEMLNGFLSCTPEFDGPGTQDSQPSPLCNGAGVPHNMSWFAFVAGGPELCVTVQPFQCAMGTGNIGLQSGVYDFCEDEGGECIGGDAFCSSGLNAIEYNVTDMIIGNTYYLFVDGCNGAECDYEITIEKGYEFVIDTPDEVVVEASCEQAPSFPDLTYCPETILEFDIWHLGDSPSDMGDYDDEGPYNPDLNATFIWTFDPPIEGMEDGEWNQLDDGYNIPPLSFEDTDVPVDYTICLTDIIVECDDQFCDVCCLTITIAPLPDELFGPYKVCIEDLLDPNGWDPGIVGEDPNGDGLFWLGPTNITYDQVLMAPMGMLSYEVFDPNCNCSFIQTVDIDVIGNIDPEPVTLYMFDCQFRDEDGDAEQYEWIWPNEIFDLDGDELEQIFNLEMVSEERDWDSERCDSLILVTVDTATVIGDLFAGPCTPSGTQYWFELDIEYLEEFYPEHPEIFPGSIIEWIRVDDGTTAANGDTINVEVADEGFYIVRVEYFFYDGAYGEEAQVTISCIKEFGPFELTSGLALSPDFLRLDTIFCVNDLTEKLFVINPFEGSTYEWTFPPGAVGVINGTPFDTATVDFTNYDFTTNLPIVALANTPCGQSPTVEIYVDTNPLPQPTISAPVEVCINELAEANFGGDPGEVMTYSWSDENYINGNQSGPGPVNYASSTPGSFDIALVVVDNNGCESLPEVHTVDVIDILDVPQPDCSTTASSIEFFWPAVEGATGYTINVLQSPTGTSTIQNTETEINVLFDGLSVNDIIEISVIANGLPPCGDSNPAQILCQALDCPDPQWEFIVFSDTSYCLNNPVDIFDFIVTGPDGTASFTGDGVSATGTFDSAGVGVGVHTITMTYTYQNGDCMRSRSIDVEIFPTPSVAFSVSDNEICLGESITIDDSLVDEVANWNGYDGGIVNAMGEISWDTPGLKTIILEVVSPDNIGNCEDQNTATVMVLDTVIMGDISCIDSGLDFVQFDWDDAFSSTGYDIGYTINGGTPITTTITDSELRIDGLMPGDEVAITVTAVSVNACPSVTSTAECIAVDCTPLVFMPIECSSVGIDFVEFSWQPVNGAESYDVYIDGVFQGNQTTTTFLVDGLMPGDVIEIRVDAINATTPCPGASRNWSCTAINCPPTDITFDNTGPHCFGPGEAPIQLEVSATGGFGGGTFTWDSPYVDPVTGVFTPEDDLDMVYSINVLYEEGDCDYPASVDVEVNIYPVAHIDVSDDDICVTETTTISTTFVANNMETPTWDFGPATVVSGSGFGPFEIQYDAAGTYEVSFMIDNAGCPSNVAVATIEVDPELFHPTVSCGATNNSSVVFEWTPVEGVTQYVVSVDGGPQLNQLSTSYTVTGLDEGETVEITLEFLTDHECSLGPITHMCTATACPESYFSLDAYDNEMCLDGTQSTQQLNIDILNAPNEVGNGSWSGEGISPTGLFNPSGVSPQADIPLNYSIQYSECSYDTTVYMTLFEAPQVTTVNPLNPDCYLENVGEVDVTVTGGTPDYTYQVDNGAPQSSSVFSPINPGLHNMLVTDANGCTTEVTFDIIPAVEPPASIGGPLSILNAETGTYTLSTTAENIGDVIWLVNGEIICQGLDCEPVIIAGSDYPDDFELVVQVFFNEDCFIETSIRVDVFDIQKWYIPNVISTTDDENSRWKMFTKGTGILVKSVKIYDRWGELVHDKEINTTDSEVDLLWEGRWGDQDGQNVIQGVYVYLIEMEVEGRQVIEAGDVTVIR